MGKSISLQVPSLFLLIKTLYLWSDIIWSLFSPESHSGMETNWLFKEWRHKHMYIPFMWGYTTTAHQPASQHNTLFFVISFFFVFSSGVTSTQVPYHSLSKTEPSEETTLVSFISFIRFFSWHEIRIFYTTRAFELFVVIIWDIIHGRQSLLVSKGRWEGRYVTLGVCG